MATNNATFISKYDIWYLLLSKHCSASCSVAVVLPGLCSGETSNLWQKLFGKDSSPISTDVDQSGTSAEGTYVKSAKTANNKIKYYNL